MPLCRALSPSPTQTGLHAFAVEVTEIRLGKSAEVAQSGDSWIPICRPEELPKGTSTPCRHVILHHFGMTGQYAYADAFSLCLPTFDLYKHGFVLCVEISAASALDGAIILSML